MNATCVGTGVDSVRVGPFDVAWDFTQLVLIKICKNVVGYARRYEVISERFCYVSFVRIQRVVVIKIELEQSFPGVVAEDHTGHTDTVVLSLLSV